MDWSQHPVMTPSTICAPPHLSLSRFPCPPSVNRLYIYGNRRVQKSNEYRNYETEVAFWRSANPDQVKKAAEFAKHLGDQVIHVDATFHMLRKNVLCKNGKPKKNDTSNRIKALHDVISASIIEIDDSYFFSGSFDKVAIDGDGDEFVDIVMSFRSV